MIAALPVAAIDAFLVFCRVGGCMMVMPGLGGVRVPVQVRLLLALSMSLAMTPVIGAGAAVPDATGALLRICALEVVIGVTVGLVLRLYLLALGFIGAAIAMAIGLGGLPGAVASEGEPQDPLAAYLSMALLALFFASDLHHAVLWGLVGTYAMLPQGVAVDPRLMLVTAVDVLGRSFVIALRLGSPFIAYALLANLALGVLNRLSPQLPVYFVALPALMIGGLALFAFALPDLLRLAVEGGRDVLHDALR